MGLYTGTAGSSGAMGIRYDIQYLLFAAHPRCPCVVFARRSTQRVRHTHTL